LSARESSLRNNNLSKRLDDRQLGQLLSQLQADNILIVTELSRIGRSILEAMSILHRIMETEAKVFTTKEHYELGNTISSKVLAFAFSLSAEIDRSIISSRTKEALARKKSEGVQLIHTYYPVTLNVACAVFD